MCDVCVCVCGVRRLNRKENNDKCLVIVIGRRPSEWKVKRRIVTTHAPKLDTEFR